MREAVPPQCCLLLSPHLCQAYPGLHQALLLVRFMTHNSLVSILDLCGFDALWVCPYVAQQRGLV